MVKLREMFPHGPGFVLVFDYMLSDLSEVIRNPGAPLTEVCLSNRVQSALWYLCMCVYAGTDQELHDDAAKGCGLSPWELHHAQGMSVSLEPGVHDQTINCLLVIFYMKGFSSQIE